MSITSNLKSLLRLDGWKNEITGLGIEGQDKRLETVASPVIPLSSQELSNMFHGDDVSYRAVTTLPEESLSKGVTVSVGGEDGIERGQAIDDELYRLDALNKLLRAAVWGRLYGGAVIIMGADDGRTQDQPLDELRKPLVYLQVLDKRKLQPDPMSLDTDPTSPTFGLPMLYDITYLLKGRKQDLGKIHRSRMIFLPGALTDDETRENNSGWDLSILQRMYSVLRDQASAWASVGSRLQEASYTKLVIKDLARMLSAGQAEAVKERVAMLNYGRSSARSIILDSEEAYTRDQDNLSGVSDLLDRLMSRTAAAVPMPVTKLWGTSAKGLNATGEGDADDWTRQVQTYREQVLGRALGALIERIVEGLGLDTDEGWDLSWPELDPMDDKERAEIYRTNAEADAVYMDQGVLMAPEVALHRFRESGYQAESGLSIDQDMRRAQISARDLVEEDQEPEVDED